MPGGIDLSNYLNFKNFQESIDLLKNNIDKAFKVFGVSFLIGLCSGLLYFIPIIGFVAIIAVALYGSIANIYLLDKLIVEKEDIPFGNCFTAPIETFKEHWGKTLWEYILLFICLLPLALIFGIVIGVSAGFMMLSAMEYGSISGLLLFILIYIAGLLLIVFFSTKLSYRLLYKVTGHIFGVDTTELIKLSKNDINKMTVIYLVSSLIPFVGFIIAIAVSYISQTKIILDVKEQLDTYEPVIDVEVNENKYEDTKCVQEEVTKSSLDSSEEILQASVKENTLETNQDNLKVVAENSGEIEQETAFEEIKVETVDEIEDLNNNSVDINQLETE